MSSPTPRPEVVTSAPLARTEFSVEGLVDALDALIERGVAVTGDVVISLAGVDLIQLDLRLLLIGVGEAARLASGASS